MEKDPSQNLNLWFQGIIAIGTLVLAFLAIFGHNLRMWLFQPKIKVYLDKEIPFLELIEEFKEKETSSSKTQYQEIRVKITNSGKTSTKSCRVLTDVIYKQRAGSEDMYKLKSIIPTEFYWSSGDNKLDLLPNIPYYISIARIAESSEQINFDQSKGELVNTKPNYELFLTIEERAQKGKYIPVGKGKLIFPIIVYAENLSNPIKKYIEIFWDADTPNDISASHFNICFVNETELKRKVGGVL